ncbi:MAG: leucine-rich repeat protein [Alistipes sp.]|nr:leucine-rich repeat protein [Alistipes sp.]
MKKLLTLFVIALTVVVSSCSKFDDSAIWDKLIEHENRITAIEELCKQMNTNIEALQTIVEALEKRDYITNVSPVRKDGEVIGYTISFAESDTITIYHGENGKDGYIPHIGVMKDNDGIYYWTVDGEWLLDGKGNKIQANGIDGGDGIDGITPRLKIENDYWYVSYDNGVTWTEVGKASGNDGVNGIDGDSIFSSVTQDDEYVYFNLADGTMITLPKHDKENIQFEDLQVKAICCKNWDTNNDGELSYAEAAAVTSVTLAPFYENTMITSFNEFRYFTGITGFSHAFSNCSNLWKISLPDSLTLIDFGSFGACENLTIVNMGNNVTHIGEGAFSGCSSLKTIQLSNSLELIGDGAFRYCGFESIVIPDSVTTIEIGSFLECSLVNVTLGANITSIGERAFFGCYSLKNVYCKAVIPPLLGADAFKTYNGTKPNCIIHSLQAIYVPSECVDVYKSASGWSGYKDLIVGYDFENNVPVE